MGSSLPDTRGSPDLSLLEDSSANRRVSERRTSGSSVTYWMSSSHVRENGVPSSNAMASSSDMNVHDSRSSPQPDHISAAPNGSPSLHRGGLLRPMSYKSPSIASQDPARPALIVPHSQDTIRLNTMELSNIMPSSPPQYPDVLHGANTAGSTDDPHTSLSSVSLDNHQPSSTSPPDACIPDSYEQTPLQSFQTFGYTAQDGSNERSDFDPPPSGLTILRREYEATDETDTQVSDLEQTTPSTVIQTPLLSFTQTSDPTVHILPKNVQIYAGNPSSLSENTPLISTTPLPPNYGPFPGKRLKRQAFVRHFVSKVFSVQQAQTYFRIALRSLPAVLLGCLLNILDGVSYGMIIFPSVGVFADLGSMGVSMFFLTTILAQLCYTFGGSGFDGANGSMMIEVVPFFHILANTIAKEIGDEESHSREIIATTLVSYSVSSILTGLSFFILGALKLGVIIGYFPRHILVGCIGGVGAFLVETGLTVSMRISDDDFQVSWDMFKFMIIDSHNLMLWTIPLALAVILRLITTRWHHQLIFPLYFVVIPIIFYIIVAAAQLDLSRLREQGWLFDMNGTTDGEWYKFYTYWDFSLVQWGPIWATLPTQFALLFFNILHPPLNVPALAVSLNEDVDTNKELVAHGYSNLIAGIFGTVPNYLVYVNTLLFYRVGGTTRIAGFLLAVATTLLLILGTGPIAYIPVMVVGALIFVLGIDLMKEALWNTRHRTSKTEYLTIVSIVVSMTVWDFVIGVLFGIVISCFFFVIQNSQRRSIRALHTGETAMSTVRRPSSHREYIKEVSKQTSVIRLQGFLFFGTITNVEETIRNIIDGTSWQRNPVRFLVLDLKMVYGIDMSAAEAFVRIQRLLASKYVTLVLCGSSVDSPVGKALQSVDVLDADGVELFSTFNDAMEWTENAYLKAWFRSQKKEIAYPCTLPGERDNYLTYQSLGSLISSPRRSHLRDAGDRTMIEDITSVPETDQTEPWNTLVRAFSSYGEVDAAQFRPIAKYFERASLQEGHVLWRQGDPSDGLYLTESGVLRATYSFTDYAPIVEESMVAGTLAGELSALSNLERNATVVVEKDAVLWKLSLENLRRMELEEPATARIFTKLVLKSAKVDYDILLSALATRQ